MVLCSGTPKQNELHHFFTALGWDSTGYGWHSFRKGGATAATKGGATPRLVMDHGR